MSSQSFFENQFFPHCLCDASWIPVWSMPKIFARCLFILSQLPARHLSYVYMTSVICDFCYWHIMAGVPTRHSYLIRAYALLWWMFWRIKLQYCTEEWKHYFVTVKISSTMITRLRGCLRPIMSEMELWNYGPSSNNRWLSRASCVIFSITRHFALWWIV